MKKIAIVVALVAIAAYAGLEIGYVTVNGRETPAPAGYTTVSVEAVSGTQSGLVTVRYVTMVPQTNTLATLSLSGGYAHAVNTNVVFKQGDFIFATGEPLTNGSANVTVRR